MKVKILSLPNAENNGAFSGMATAHGMNVSDGLTHIDAGGSHEANPNDGVQMGADENGTPNLVEEGEVVYDDYVFSDRLKVPAQTVEKGKRPTRAQKLLKRYEGKSFATVAKKLEKLCGVDENPTDNMAQNTFKADLELLAEVQEEIRQKEQMMELQEQLAQMSPEEREALLQQIMQQAQAEQQPQQPQMTEEEFNQLSPEEQQAYMQQMQGGQQMPQEGQMSPKEAQMMQQQQMQQPQMSPEEQAYQQQMMQQQMPPQQMGGQPMMEQPQYANGGYLYADGGEVNPMVSSPTELQQNVDETVDTAQQNIEQPAEAIDESQQAVEQAAPQEEQPERKSAEEMSTKELNAALDEIIQYAKDSGDKQLLREAKKLKKKGSRDDKEEFVDEMLEEIDDERMHQEQIDAQNAQPSPEEIAAQQQEQPQMMQPSQEEMTAQQMMQQPSQEEMAAQELAAQGNTAPQYAEGGVLNSGSMSLNNPNTSIYSGENPEEDPELAAYIQSMIAAGKVTNDYDVQKIINDYYVSKRQNDITNREVLAEQAKQDALNQVDSSELEEVVNARKSAYNNVVKRLTDLAEGSSSSAAIYKRVLDKIIEKTGKAPETFNNNDWAFVLDQLYQNRAISKAAKKQQENAEDKLNKEYTKKVGTSDVSKMSRSVAAQYRNDLNNLNKYYKDSSTSFTTQEAPQFWIDTYKGTSSNNSLKYRMNEADTAANQSMMNNWATKTNSVALTYNSDGTINRYSSAVTPNMITTIGNYGVYNPTDKNWSYTNLNPLTEMSDEELAKMGITKNASKTVRDWSTYGYIDKSGVWHDNKAAKENTINGAEEGKYKAINWKFGKNNDYTNDAKGVRDYEFSNAYLDNYTDFVRAINTGDQTALDRLYQLGEISRDTTGKNRYFKGDRASLDDLVDNAVAKYYYTPGTENYLYIDENVSKIITKEQLSKLSPEERAKAKPMSQDDARKLFRDSINNNSGYTLLGKAMFDRNNAQAHMMANTKSVNSYIRNVVEDGNGNYLTMLGFNPTNEAYKDLYTSAKEDTTDDNGLTTRYWKINGDQNIARGKDGKWYMVTPDVAKTLKPLQYEEGMPVFGDANKSPGDNGKLSYYELDDDILPDGTVAPKTDKDSNLQQGQHYMDVPEASKLPLNLGLGLQAGATLWNALRPADYSNADMIANAAKSASNWMPIGAKPLGDYLTYRPLDRNYEGNKIQAQMAAERRSLENLSGGNRGTRAANILMSDYNMIGQLGDADRKAAEENRAQEQQVATFNKDTNKYNSQAFLEADKANQNAFMQAQQAGLSGISAAAQMRENIAQQKANAISTGIKGIADSLYNRYAQDLANKQFEYTMKNYPYANYLPTSVTAKKDANGNDVNYGTRQVAPVAGKNPSRGGKINRKKRRSLL